MAASSHGDTAVLRQSSHIRIGYPIHHFRGVNLPTHRGHLQQFARTQDEPALPRAVTVMAVPDPPAKPAQAADAAAGSPARAGAPPSRRAEATATTAASSAKVTAGTAPYVTRPTGWTVFLRTFVPWQLWRFVRINAKMIRIIRRPRTSRR